MDDAERILKTICSTCLSVDRKLSQLCKINNSVNNLFFLLAYESDAYDEIFYKSTTHLSICWECEAIMQKLCKFKNQATEAQKQLTDLIHGKIHDVCEVISISKLNYYYQKEYNKQYTENDETLTHFIDCGQNLVIGDIKSESDSDIPLCEFTSENEDKNFKNSFENKIKVKRKKDTDTKIIHNNVFNNIILKKEAHNKIIFNKKELEENKIEYRIKVNSTENKFYSTNELSKEINENMEQIKENEVTSKIIEWNKKIPTRKKKKQINDKKQLNYVCTECNKCFANKSQKYKHMKINHCSGIPCTVCGKTFAFKHHLKSHERIHSIPLNREQCPICGKMVRCDLTKAHARVHTDRQRVECLKCDKTFVSQESYRNHLKYTSSHTTMDVLKYKCTMCKKAYRSKGELRDHVNYQHMGKTQHKCPICDKAIATRRGIARHVKRAHQGIKENAKDKICQTCGKVFRDKRCLLEHELIHSGERPLSCSMCGRTFRQRASLYTHRRRVHNIQPTVKIVQHTGSTTLDTHANAGCCEDRGQSQSKRNGTDTITDSTSGFATYPWIIFLPLLTEYCGRRPPQVATTVCSLITFLIT